MTEIDLESFGINDLRDLTLKLWEIIDYKNQEIRELKEKIRYLENRYESI